MRYLPHTPEDLADMLAVVGVANLDDLFSTIPADCRRADAMDLPEPLTEWELNEHMDALAADTAAGRACKVFIGAGSYSHFIPASVSYLLSRSEFVTAYTPYQPEISQGTLQAIYEYQTLVSWLLGMDVANASLYDGGSALAEALLMAVRATRKNKVAVAKLAHPLHRRVVRTYFEPTGYEVVELGYTKEGRTDPAALDAMDDLAAVAVQSPSFFGTIEDLKTLADKAHEKGALLIASFTEPLAYGLLKNPGSLGADIACGDGQSIGIPQSFGGPGLGMFACKKKYLRGMPGRLVGKTTDMDGKRGYVLTLATREQHIRRERATSNICTNNSWCALTAAAYMASLGGTGIRELAALNRDKAEYLKSGLNKAGIATPFAAPTFNEFVARFPDGFETRYQELLQQGIVAGLPLSRWYPELAGHYLLCATETMARSDLDDLIREAGA